VADRCRILVLGVGNELNGDDGVGPLALAALAEGSVPEGVELMDGSTRGLDLLYPLQDCDQALVIDAVADGGAGGRLLDFNLEEVSLKEAGGSLSLHELDLGGVVLLARALKEPLPPIHVIGLTPSRREPGGGLSPECEKMMPELLARVREHLARIIESEHSMLRSRNGVHQ